MSSDVLQRKLQGVYDCIDTRNFKGALKLCQKKDLQKYDLTKTLMAYSLISMDRIDEGLTLAREVKDNIPTDTTVLKTLSQCLGLAFRYEEVAECYEKAWQQQPTSEELGVELFRAHAKCTDAKKMQGDAMKLYKTFHKPKYVFWAVCCMMQQSQSSATVTVLAERMLRRVMFETQALRAPKRTAGAEEAFLWAQVLTRQAESEASPENRLARLHEAVESLRQFGSLSEHAIGDSHRPMHSLAEREYRIDSDVQFKSDPSIIELHPFLCKMRELQLVQTILSTCFEDGLDSVQSDSSKNYGARSDYQLQLESLLETIIFNYPDQWDVHKQWVDHVILKGLATEVTAHREKLISMQTNYPKLRGPYLAELYLFSEACSRDIALCATWAPSSLTSDIEELSALPSNANFDNEMSRIICRYVALFDHKDCCFTDVKGYLEKLFRTPSSSIPTAAQETTVNWLLKRRKSTTVATWKAILDNSATPNINRDTFCRLNKLDQLLHSVSASHTPHTLFFERLCMHASAKSDLGISSEAVVRSLEDRGIKVGDNFLVIMSAWVQDALVGCSHILDSVVPQDVCRVLPFILIGF